MNKDRKAEIVQEVASLIEGAGAVFAVDYRGISVPEAAELRRRLGEAGASFRVVKNTLTRLAADRAEAAELKQLLDGPTALTFVKPDGDPVLAAKALSTFRRERELLEFKGGQMEGAPLSVEELQALARLPGREALQAQLVAVIASPITGLVRGLNGLIAGLASQLRQIADQGLVGGGDAQAAARPAAEAPEEASQPAQQEAQRQEASDEAQESSGEGEGSEPSTEAEQEKSDESPSEGE
ncbi:MAG TPA: 50S ribosomal protein L10 [Thermoleophilaceae bacterium]|jgi:large subunit ribosomal protein L10|nr:50S ribosomal protein L10 [Thermoleophilaceae bacterium]